MDVRHRNLQIYTTSPLALSSVRVNPSCKGEKPGLDLKTMHVGRRRRLYSLYPRGDILTELRAYVCHLWVLSRSAHLPPPPALLSPVTQGHDSTMQGPSIASPVHYVHTAPRLSSNRRAIYSHPQLEKCLYLPYRVDCLHLVFSRQKRI